MDAKAWKWHTKGARPLGLWLLLGGLAGLGSPQWAGADENFFGYSYGSETAPKGSWEFYQWVTWREGKGEGTYNAFDFRTELEYGITDRLQGSLYLNTAYHKTKDTGPIDEDTGLHEIPNQDSFGFQGVSAEFKYRLLSPYKDPIGLALYIEPSYSRINKISGITGTEYEIEPKIILQKNFLEDQLITVLNFTGEFEWERFPESEATERELKLELSGGVAYHIAPNWYAGLEARVQGVYPNMNLGNREAWAFFAGPAVHYNSNKWWFTLSIMPQLTGSPRDPALSSHLHLDEFERTEVRLKVGYYF